MNHKRTWALLVAGLAWSTPSFAQESEAVPEAVPEPVQVIHSFKAALQAGDSLAALSFLHPDVVIYESGRAEDLEAYRSGHLRGDMRFLAAVAQETTAWDMFGDGEMVTVVSETHTTGTMGEREIDSRGTETMVLLFGGGAWRIRHIHWSNR